MTCDCVWCKFFTAVPAIIETLLIFVGVAFLVWGAIDILQGHGNLEWKTKESGYRNLIIGQLICIAVALIWGGK